MYYAVKSNSNEQIVRELDFTYRYEGKYIILFNGNNAVLKVRMNENETKNFKVILQVNIQDEYSELNNSTCIVDITGSKLNSNSNINIEFSFEFNVTNILTNFDLYPDIITKLYKLRNNRVVQLVELTK